MTFITPYVSLGACNTGVAGNEHFQVFEKSNFPEERGAGLTLGGFVRPETPK